MNRKVLDQLAGRQRDAVAVWQLRGEGWTKDAVAHRTAGMRRHHSGVILTNRGDPTRLQRAQSAVLTAPGSFLDLWSAAALYALCDYSGRIDYVVRDGDGGPRRYGSLSVRYSTTLEGETTVVDGVPIVTVERLLIDIARRQSERAYTRMVREALRRGLTTCERLLDACDRHPRRPGARRLRRLAARYSHLRMERCKSPAECRGIELLDLTRRPLPAVNEDVAGEEADFYWEQYALILEIDGPQWHRLRDIDARKEAAWRAADKTVRRTPSDDVFDHPERFLALCPPPLPEPPKRRRRT